MHRKLAMMVLAAIASTMTVVVVPASPAAAACWAVSCEGGNPDGQCTAVDPHSGQVGYWGSVPASTVQLRYSPGCASFWARGKMDCLPSGGNPITYVRITRQIYGYYNYYTSSQHYSGQVPCYGYWAWSPMVADYGNDRARACLFMGYTWDAPQNLPDSAWSQCTPWYY